MKKLTLIALIFCAAFASANEVSELLNTNLRRGQFDKILNGQDTLVIYHVLPLPTHLRELVIAPEVPDSLASEEADTIADEPHKPIRKATLATCSNDRTVVTDQDGNMLEFIEYFYQNDKEAGQATWQWENGTKKGITKTIKQFNDAGKQTLEAKYTWNPKANNGQGDWKGSTCSEWKYDESGRNTDIIDYFGVNAAGEWQGSNWTHYDYEGYIEPVGITEYIWDYGKNDWDAISQEGHIISETLSVDSLMEKDEDGKWVGIEKTLEELDNLTNIIREESYNGWDENGWVGTSKTTMKYVKSRMTEQITYTWSNGWVEATKIERLYDGSNLLDDKSFTKSGDNWIGKSRVTKTFDGSAVASLTNWTWSAGDWTEKDSTHYTYAYTNKIDEEIYIIRSNNAWLNSKKTKNTYNASQRLTSTAISEWKNDNWVGVELTELEYTGTLVSQKTTSTWDGEWIPAAQERHKFDTSNNDTLTVKAIWQDGAWQSTDSLHWILRKETINKKACTLHDEKREWSSTTGLWKTKSKVTDSFDEKANSLDKQTYTFNSNGECTQIVRQEYSYWNSNKSYKTLERKTTWTTAKGWVGNTKTVRTYNAKSKATLEEKYNKWDATKGAEDFDNGWWQSSATTYKTETEYNASNSITKQIKSKWDKTKWAWIPYTQTENEYTNNLNTAIIISDWNATTEKWVPTKKTIYEYNASKQKTQEIVQTYNAATEQFVNQSRTDYAYSTGVSAASRTDIFTWLVENESGKWCQTAHTEFTYEGTTKRTKEVATFNNCEQTSLKTEVYHNSCDAPVYIVTFANWDEQQLTSVSAAAGDTPHVPSTLIAPTRDADEQYTYTFSGWGNGLVPADRDTTYLASFATTLNQYTVTFLDEDGTTVLSSKKYDYGTTPTCATPTKQGDAQYTYTFNGWNTEIVPVTGDATYTATYLSSINQYTVTFFDEDGTTILASNEYDYGATPVAPAVPTKDATAQYTFTFAGWDKVIAPVTGDATYTATYSSTINTYTITFVDEDGTTVLSSEQYEYGATPVAPADPTKDATAQYTFTFAGWDKVIAPVTGDATYTATYSSTINTYTVTFVVKDNPELNYPIVDVPYGTMLGDLIELAKAAVGGDSFEDDTYIYTFAGVENAAPTDIITEDTTFYILYTKTEKAPTFISNVETTAPVQKIIRDNHVFILRDGHIYTATGVAVQ